MKQPISLFLLAAAFVNTSGCGPKPARVLGTAPASDASLTVRQISSAKSGQALTVTGEMTEKCPVAGCWFMLKDKTGVVRVDTKASGFVVSDVPLHSTVTVSGTAVVSAGSQAGVAATGVRY